MPPPERPKIYHIVHVDRIPSIIADDALCSDALMLAGKGRGIAGGTAIGMNSIKRRRHGLRLACHPGLHVGQCVPFHFCPRSIMLYVIHRGNHADLPWRGGQRAIVHLEADLLATIAWADAHKRRWAFTLSNAGAHNCESHADISALHRINWHAIQARDWHSPSVKEGKQAEFLVERSFPWHLVERIGVPLPRIKEDLTIILDKASHRPAIEVRPDWYY